MATKTLTIDGTLCTARAEDTVLAAARDAGIRIPTLCQLDGVTPHGGCRVCLVEVAGQNRLYPACTTQVWEGMDVRSSTPKLQEYRKMIVELLFAERNHVCSVCVANGHCELQTLAYSLGVNHVRFEYQSPELPVDVSHERFGVDHNRCILCTRCVRTCDQIEGAHTWDVMGRGGHSRVILPHRRTLPPGRHRGGDGKGPQDAGVPGQRPREEAMERLRDRRSAISFQLSARRGERSRHDRNVPVPKGRNRKAQGNALGTDRVGLLSPSGAK
jgi:bidirectional [NiFe] hydrogenase diaphorase subunit